MSAATNDRLYSHCVWYAFGQQDAGIGKGRGVEVAEFAQGYVDHAMSGSSFIPSIQDAWKAYIARKAMDNAEESMAIAGISDEVRDFLAKSIDEATS